jgi:hypothetical protein
MATKGAAMIHDIDLPDLGLARALVWAALVASASAGWAQAPGLDDKAEAAVAPPAPDCPVTAQRAEADLERGRAAEAAKAWKDAAVAWREASAGFLAVAANCPATAAHAGRQGDLATQGLKRAEAQLAHQSDCLPRIDKALDLDIRAATARAGGGNPAEVERVLAEAEAQWREAAGACQPPHREKAERSLAATIKARAANQELLSGGPACDAAWKNATTLGDLAKGAWKEKRWDDAAMLYGKAGLAWDGAADKCAGERQQTAQRKSEQTWVDAHNAEHCGPLWDAATELTQRLKTGAVGADQTERDQMSVKAEVAWREAVGKCKGSPQMQARTNADALARERGAPLPPSVMAQFAGKGVGPQLAATSAAKSGGPAVALSAAGIAAPAASGAAAASASGPVSPAQPGVLIAGDTVFRGQFVADRETGEVSGSGTVEWANGESFVGAVVKGKRQGKGRFNWVGGQWYEGDWVDDRAMGQGVIQFAGGNRYEGAVVDGEPQGRGTMVFAFGDRYTGEFVHAVPHGQGTYIWKSGNRYDGAWSLGKKHGQGKLVWADGVIWEGEFRDDQESDNIRITNPPPQRLVADNAATAAPATPTAAGAPSASR